MNKYMELKVVGNTEELQEFVSLLHLIQSFGQYGMNRDIEVKVDGDGSGKLNFQTKEENGEYKDFESFKLDDLHTLEKSKEKYTVYIGE